MKIRRAVRALLVDPNGAVLLMQLTDPSTDRAVWITPGGGVDDGETLHEALRRELDEEIAYELADEATDTHVWTRRHTFVWNGAAYDQSENFFLVATERFTPERCAEGNPAVGMSDAPHRWWTADEIVSSEDNFAPRQLGDALAALLADGPPDRPYDVGV